MESNDAYVASATGNPSDPSRPVELTLKGYLDDQVIRDVRVLFAKELYSV